MSVTRDELERRLAAARVPEPARRLARAIFTAPPGRSTESGRGNVATRVPDPLTMESQELESRLLELRQYWTLRQDPSVLHFATQPGAQVAIRDGCERPHAWPTTPDFFVLWHDRAGFIETRTEARVAKLLAKHPGLYEPTGRPGEYACPGAAAWTSEREVSYVVRTPEAFSTIQTRNWMYLASHAARALERGDAERVVDRVRRRPGITISALADIVPVGDILWCVATAHVYADLTRHVVADHDHTHLYLDRLTAMVHEHAAPAARAIGHGAPAAVRLERGAKLRLADAALEVEVPGIHDVVVRDLRDGSCRSYARRDLEAFARDGILVPDNTGEPDPVAAARTAVYELASPCSIDRAVARAVALGLAPREAARGPVPAFSERHLRRLRRQQREVAALTGDPIAGLIPVKASGGGRHLDPRVDEVTQRLVETHTLSTQPLAAADIARLIQAELKTMGLEDLAPSDRTVARRLHRISEHAKLLAQRGRRGANGVAPRQAVDPDDAPPNGEAPWSVAHLDSTLLDIETRCATTGRNLGRIQATILVDGYSGLFLAWVLHYAAPSAATALRVLRDCVARWGRLPDLIVVDQGPEFHSVEFQQACAWAGVAIRYRPTAQPRFGSPVERAFLELTRIVHRLRGQTRNRRDPRASDGDKDASKLALWDLASLSSHIAEGIDAIHDVPIQAKGASRRELFETGIATHGVVTSRILRVDDPAFRAFTLPLASGGGRTVHPVNGISVHYITYWNDAFTKPELTGSKVEVRYDPDDVSHVFALVNGTWLECFGREVARMRVISAEEWQAASEAVAERNRAIRRARRASGSQIAKHIESGLETEKLLLARFKAQAEYTPPIEPGDTPGQPAPTIAAMPLAGASQQEEPADQPAPSESLLDESNEYQGRWWHEAS